MLYAFDTALHAAGEAINTTLALYWCTFFTTLLALLYGKRMWTIAALVVAGLCANLAYLVAVREFSVPHWQESLGHMGLWWSSTLLAAFALGALIRLRHGGAFEPHAESGSTAQTGVSGVRRR